MLEGDGVTCTMAGKASSPTMPVLFGTNAKPREALLRTNCKPVKLQAAQNGFGKL